MELSRREALKWGLVGGGILLFPWTMGKPALAQFSPQIPRFELPFKIPPVLNPVRSDRDTDYYEITLEKASLEILPGLTTEIWGYNGMTPGPTIRQRGGTRSSGGKESVVRFINKLGIDGQGREIRTTTHLHGMASLPQYDGYAEDYTPYNFFKDYFYPNDRAATIWYHDHALDFTARNVYMGLAGMYIVEDQYELDLPLPKGEYDLPLILQDKQFAVDGSLIFDDRNQRSLYGDVMLVNGVPWPRLPVERRKYRFRILNASASRNYHLVLSRYQESQSLGDEMIVIGSDGGLLGSPVSLTSPVQTLRVAMAERYDIIIDFSEYPLGSQVYLRNIGFTGTIDTDTRSHTLMRFDVVKNASDDVDIPSVLRPVKPIDIPSRACLQSVKLSKTTH